MLNRHREASALSIRTGGLVSAALDGPTVQIPAATGLTPRIVTHREQLSGFPSIHHLFPFFTMVRWQMVISEIPGHQNNSACA